MIKIKLNAKKISILLIILSILILSIFFPRFIKRKNPDEIIKITKHISTVFELPSETPTLAVITDTTQLSNQKFFQAAQNGDRVLMYEKNGIAILYRPKTKKIIHITTLTIGEIPTFTK